MSLTTKPSSWDGSREYAKPASALERSMIEAGRKRYLQQAQRGFGARQTATNKSVVAYAANIEAWTVNAIASKKAGLGVGFALFLREAIDVCGAEVVAITAARSIMDGASQGSSAASCAMYAARAVETETKAQLFKERNPYMFLASQELSRLSRFVGNRKESQIEKWLKQGRCTRDSLFLRNYKWSTQTRATLGIVLLHLFKAATGYIHIHSVRERGRLHAINKVVLSEDYQTWKGSLDDRKSLMKPFLLPLNTPPVPWTCGEPEIGGYSHRFIRLIKSGSTEEPYDVDTLRDEDSYGPVVAALNRLQATAWRLNPTVVEMAHHCEANPYGLPDSVVPPQPEAYPMEAESPKALKFLRARYHLVNRTAAGRRIRLTRTLETLKEVQKIGEPLYFPCNLDYRSRMYSASSNLLTFQGGDLSRGVLELHQPELLSVDGADALMVHGANCWGLDKETIEDRIAWVKSVEDNILEVQQDPKACRWWTHAEEPWKFLNFCLNFKQECRTVAWADATSNGFQFIATLTGDEKLARLTNLIPGEKREDLYTYITELVIPEALAQCGKHPSLKHCFDRGINRDLLKPVIMAIPYGVSVIGMSRLLSEDLLKWIRTQPTSTDPLDRYIDGAARLTTIIHEVVKREFPKLNQLLSLLQKAARIRLKNGHGVEWTTPTGWPWRQAIPQCQTVIIRPTLSPEVTLWTEVGEEQDGTLDLERNVSATPANFIHSLDAAVLQMAINNLPPGVPVASVHDCIGTHPNYMAQFQQVYRESFRDVVSMPLVQTFLNQNVSLEEQVDLEGLIQAVQPLSKNTIDQMVSSRYLIS